MLTYDPPQRGRTRRSLLTSLAAELRKLEAPVLIALSESDHPVLYTVRGGQWVAVVAAQYGDGWWFLWGGNDQVAADAPELAARFLHGIRASVTELFTRRPLARGAGAPLTAVA